MKALSCIVVDDEPLAVKMLENFISKTSFLSLEASFTDPVAALEAIRSRRPQLVFLDIQMPDLNGMELSRMVPDGTRVIFTTAFKDYAFDSYEVSALDFLRTGRASSSPRLSRTTPSTATRCPRWTSS